MTRRFNYYKDNIVCLYPSVGDSPIPPGGGGCPLDDDRMPLKGVLMREAALNLFGSVTVNSAGASGEDSTGCADGVPSKFERGFDGCCWQAAGHGLNLFVTVK
jgi:hypothetical protein